jgi:hypothetical protein
VRLTAEHLAKELHAQGLLVEGDGLLDRHCLLGLIISLAKPIFLCPNYEGKSRKQTTSQSTVVHNREHFRP